MKRAMHIFRRDLRLEDNTALIEAISKADEVICAFIFDPRQVEKNPYRSDKCVQFMLESLEDVEAELRKRKAKLHFFYDKPDKVVETIIKKHGVDGVFVNRDYTPFSKRRDQAIEKVCKKHKVDFFQADDALLVAPEAVKTGGGKPYTVFTPFYNKVKARPQPKPRTCPSLSSVDTKLTSEKTDALFKRILKKRDPKTKVEGGRTAGLKLLKSLRDQSDYKKSHDLLTHDTTLLSAHNKFGTLSVREVYHALKTRLKSKATPIIRQLYWRDFYTHIAFHYPHIFGEPYRSKYKKLKWTNNKSHFKKWCEGKTGVPVVDAGMRQLNEMGWMHNRARLIVGSYLTKDLHIDWRWGEKYFAQKLIDYDPSVNNGNWQWVASTGCDSAPYFRIFNPWSQQKKFDPKAEYIKRWVPELKDLEAKEIHALHDKRPDTLDYPEELVDHQEESRKAKAWYKRCD